ncbi:MAG: Hint domain-containing protein [Lachnospiraceae bacterium]|nr:Hint domain-containing protein [Lachnospiraceae bacterium]
MATIALYASYMEQMSGMFQNVRNSLKDYKEELFRLDQKLSGTSVEAADMTAVIDSIRASTRLQERKMEFLNQVEANTESYVEEVEQIDGEVAELINGGKQNFYKDYDYLKPGSECGDWEKIKRDFQKAEDWCREHWKDIIGVIIVIGVVVLELAFFAPGALAIIFKFTGAVLLHALEGAALGGIIGGVLNRIFGDSFWDGFKEGAKWGAIFGSFHGVGAYLGKTSGLIAKLAGIDKIKKVFCMVTKGLLLSTSLMGVFDLLTMAMKHFHLDNVFTRWNESLHSHKDYNVFQFTITALTSFMTGIGRGYRANVCFIAGTMVMTAAGLMAIEQIKAGDLVLTTSPDTYETVYKKVAETYERETKDLLHLQITGAGRTDRIVTTPNHPFYVAGKGFVKAGDLREGDELCASSSIEKVTIEKILPEVAKEPVKVYNLQVEDFHTYHVGALGVWVHNCTPAVKEEGTGKQVISNKFPYDNQAGRTFEFTIEDGRVHIENGIQDVDFIIDMDGNLHIGRGHSYLAGDQNVQAAGTLKVNCQGYIRIITNESGHFQPTLSEALNYLQIFRHYGLDIENAWIRISEFDTSLSNYVIDSKVFYNGPIRYLPEREGMIWRK